MENEDREALMKAFKAKRALTVEPKSDKAVGAFKDGRVISSVLTFSVMRVEWGLLTASLEVSPRHQLHWPLPLIPSL